MAKATVYDMTKGKELPLLIKFSLPMLLGNIFQQLYNLVDSIIVGQFVGANALGAVGSTGSINFLLFSLCLGLSIGIGILIAQFFGANQHENIKKSIANTIYIVGVTGILMSVIGVVLARPLLTALHTPASQLEDAITYMRIVTAGTIAVSCYNAISSILRALGDSRTPLIFLIVASVVNVVLDIILIRFVGLGVSGAAIATVISQCISSIGCILYAVRYNPYFRLRRDHMKVDRQIIGKCVRIGVPVAFQNALISVSCIVLQRVVNGFGEQIVTVYTTTNRIEQLMHAPYNTLSAALSSFTGQNIGAKQIKRVKKGFHISIAIVAIISFTMFIFMHLFGENILSLFTKDAKIKELGAKGLSITSCFYFMLGMIYTTRGLLNGAGDAFASMVNGVVEVVGRILFPILFIYVFSSGYWGIWYTTGLTWAITGIVVYIRYLQGKWVQKTLVLDEMGNEIN